MKVGIAIDSWKLKIFKRRLDLAGFPFKKNPGVTDDTLLLTVDTDDPARLGKLVLEANKEARAKKGEEN